MLFKWSFLGMYDTTKISNTLYVDDVFIFLYCFDNVN